MKASVLVVDPASHLDHSSRVGQLSHIEKSLEGHPLQGSFQFHYVQSLTAYLHQNPEVIPKIIFIIDPCASIPCNHPSEPCIVTMDDLKGTLPDTKFIYLSKPTFGGIACPFVVMDNLFDYPVGKSSYADRIIITLESIASKKPIPAQTTN